MVPFHLLGPVTNFSALFNWFSMFDVLICVTEYHDPWVVLLAAGLCLLSSYVAMSLIRRSRCVSGMPRTIWVLSSAAAGGFGIWATHFVGMLAYDPGVVVGYDSKLTFLSLLVAIVATGGASAATSFWSAQKGGIAAGILFGTGVCAMHFMGMQAMRFPGHILWDPVYVVASAVAAVVLAIPAFHFAITLKHNIRSVALSTTLLALSVVVMHFTAMTAITTIPDPSIGITSHLISPFSMIVMISVVAASLLFAGLSAAVLAMRAEASTHASEEQFRILVQGVSDHALYMLDQNGNISSWNPGAKRMMGYERREILGQSPAIFYPPENDGVAIHAASLATAAEFGKYTGEGWRLRRDGTRFWGQVLIEAIRGENGQLIGFAKITRDQTEKRQAEAALRMSARNLQLALDHMANAICLFDADGTLLMYNRRLEEIGDLDPSIDLRGRSLKEICQLHPEGSEARIQAYERMIAQKHGTWTETLPNGKTVHARYVPTDSESWLITIEDITTRMRSEQRIAHLSHHDQLTGLPNRQTLIETLDQRLPLVDLQHGKLALVNLDIQRFKDINDSYGNAVGDEVLCVLAQNLRKILKPEELIARIGGDEFACITPYRNAASLQEFVQRVMGAINTPLVVDDASIQLQASLGIAVYPQDASDREKLLSNANLALARAKADNCEKTRFYDADMEEAERERRQMAQDIWTALREDQFYLTYQVQCAAGSHKVTGYEVLLRWQHPRLGLVPPNVFIPLAEQYGSISALSEWVLEHACRDAAGWKDPIRIAVNISPVQLAQTDLSELVERTLTKTGLDPKRLELEVTETAVIGDKNIALEILGRIRELGVTIAIDDFGTGYSSLETLRAFPFDKIKLDRSFVTDIDTNRHSKAFIRAMLALGKSLAIPVLAEGIENECQMALLTEEGCDQFQGYFFGKPAVMEQALSQVNLSIS